MVVITGSNICVKSDDNTHVHRVRLPDQGNISSIKISQVPEGLLRIHYLIGNNTILSVEKCDIKLDNASLFPSFPTSLAYYMTKTLEFVYDNTNMEQQTFYDEEVDEISYSNEDVEIFDGSEFIFGKLVTRTKKTTGKQSCRYTFVPDVIVTVDDPVTEPKRECVDVPFWKAVQLRVSDNRWIVDRKIRVKKTLEGQEIHFIQEDGAYLVEHFIRFSGGCCGVTSC